MNTLHHVVILAFLVFYAYKVLLLLTGQTTMLDSLRARLPWLDAVLGTGVLLSGGYLALGYAGAWPWWLVMKIILVLGLLPLSLVALRRKNRLLGLLTLLVFGYVYGVGYTRSLTLQRTPYGEPPTSPTDPRHGRMLSGLKSTPVEDTVQTGGLIGKMLYRENCIRCHGLNGDKCLYGARNLQQSTLSLEARMALISHGRGKMPAFSPRLNDQQLQAVARFSQTLFKADSATVAREHQF